MKKFISKWFLLFMILVLAAGALSACVGVEEEFVEEEAPVTEVAEQGTEEVIKEESTEPETGESSEEEAPSDVPDTWLVMMYEDADDGTLEQDIFIDVNEAEIVGSTEDVKIVAQLDRYDGSYDGDGDWTGTKRFLITQDDDLETINSEELEDLGEINMADNQSLIDFATWAIENYPSGHYALIMSDHGMGWPGGWTDPDPIEGSEMGMDKIDEALMTIVETTGIGQFDFVGFDACLMSQVESLSAIAPFALYATASEETEPSLGWAYAQFLGELTANPGMNGGELAKEIVSSYIEQDFRITNDEARQVLVSENYGYEGEISAEEVAAEMATDITLTAIDLSGMADINEALNDFVMVITEADPDAVAAARSYAQAYSSIFGKEYPESFFDLGHFVSLVMEESGDEVVNQAGQKVLDAIQNAVLAEKHGDNRPGSTGFSIYFPNSEVYQMTAYGDWLPYTQKAARFAVASLWDDFLAYFYTGQAIDPSTADLSVLTPATPKNDLSAATASNPEEGTTVESPGAGGLTVEPLELSATEISSGETVTISTTISGENIGFIYYYAALYNESDDSYMTADMGYIEADQFKEVGGITYPDWGDEGEVSIESEWEPTIYFLSDGTTEEFAYFEPQVYGATLEEDSYVVYGVYGFAGTDKTQEAMIEFDGNGKMKRVWVFTDDEGVGAPSEATPKAGDTFTIWVEWLELNEETQEYDYVYYQGGTLTFSDKAFEIVPYDVYPGLYEIGIIAEDYNGDYQEAYAEVTIK